MMTQKWHATLGHPKTHPHTKFGIPTSKNIEVMPILETRPEAKVTKNGIGQSDIPRCIHTLNLRLIPQIIKEICSRYYYSKNEVKVKFKVSVTRKWYTTLHNPKMHPHTKFGIPTSNNIRDMFWTRLFYKLGQSSK